MSDIETWASVKHECNISSEITDTADPVSHYIVIDFPLILHLTLSGCVVAELLTLVVWIIIYLWLFSVNPSSLAISRMSSFL